MKLSTLVGSRRGRIAFAATTALALVVGVGLPRISAQAAGGTVNVNPSPTFQNNNANVTEGNFGTAPVNVTFALSQDNANQVTVHYTTADGTATAPSDYVAQSGDVVFAPHETSKNVVFNAKGDTVDEANETFKVQIGTITQTGPDSYTKGADGTVTILDDDAAPGMSVPDVAVNEGTDGSPSAPKTKMTFTAHLSSPAGSDQTFYVFTGNPTRDSDPNTSGVQPHRAATAGTDYTALNGAPIVIKAGDQNATFDVLVTPDTVDEFDEWLAVTVKSTNDANAPNVADGEGKITDDDAAPRLDVGDPAPVTEPDVPCGNLGQPACTTTIDFVVTLSQASDKPVIVDYATHDRTATSGANDNSDDYIGRSGSGNPSDTPPGDGLVFQPGETSKTIKVPVRGDTTAEPDEFFVLDLTNPVNAQLGDAEANGLIQNNDGGSFPTVSVSDAPAAAESSGGTPGTSTFTISVSRPPLNTASVTVFYQTADGPESGTGAAAVAGSDYVAKTGSVTIDFPNTSATVPVSLKNDSKNEPDEFFQLQLTGASNSAITDPVGQAKITDEDPAPTLSIADKAITEGTGTTPTAGTMTVTLSAPSGQTVTVHYATPQPNSGTATTGTDYTDTAGDLTFAPGDTSKTFDIPVTADNIDEDAETVVAQLSNSTGAGISHGTGTLTINDDDGAPAITIGNVTVTEGSSSNTNAAFPVQLSAPSSKPITVHVATNDGSGTATTGADYTKSAADLTFNPGETEKDFNVPVVADTVDEANETFTATISAPNANGTIGTPSTGTATITDDDTGPLPSVSVGNASAAEGDPVTFTFTLSSPATSDVTVNYSTADGTATTGDYTPVPAGVATITAGQTTKTVDVATTEDTTDEGNETFTLTINSADGANVDPAHKTGTGTITNDDGAVTKAQITTGAGPGGGPHIQSFPANSSTATVGFMDGSETTGKRVARGDLDGDGSDEIITGSGPNSASVVSVYSAAGQLKASAFAYAGGRFYGGVFVAAGDVDGDGKAEVITGAGPGGGPHVIVWKLAGNQLNPVDGGFFAYGSNFAGGVTVTTGDVNGDGKADIITGPGAGGGPDVEAFSGADRSRLFGFMAYTDPNAQPNWTGGVNVAAGDLDHDGKAEIVVAPWSGGGPHVRTFNHDGSLRNGGIFVGPPNFPGGVTVAVGDLNGDGSAEIVVGVWTGTNRVKVYLGDLSPTSIDYAPYGDFGGGNFVAVGKI
ncbi:MAG: large repetitive protein [Actinomycetota bacterium]|jgi:hypothetical protein